MQDGRKDEKFSQNQIYMQERNIFSKSILSFLSLFFIGWVCINGRKASMEVCTVVEHLEHVAESYWQK